MVLTWNSNCFREVRIRTDEEQTESAFGQIEKRLKLDKVTNTKVDIDCQGSPIDCETGQLGETVDVVTDGNDAVQEGRDLIVQILISNTLWLIKNRRVESNT